MSHAFNEEDRRRRSRASGRKFAKQQDAMTTPTTPPVDLQAIEARCEAATEGPWIVDEFGAVPFNPKNKDPFHERGAGVLSGDKEVVIGGMQDEQGGAVGVASNDDATFIAHARTDIPALLSLLREKDQVIERLERAGERMTIDHGALEAELATLKAGQEAREMDWARYLIADFERTGSIGPLATLWQSFNATHSGEKMK